jgi:hypothetical protein
LILVPRQIMIVVTYVQALTGDSSRNSRTRLDAARLVRAFDHGHA